MTWSISKQLVLSLNARIIHPMESLTAFCHTEFLFELVPIEKAEWLFNTQHFFEQWTALHSR